jgi:hypothetical protein
MHTIESWWKHNGVWDREQASGIPYEDYDGETEIYLDTTDEWWDNLTDQEKREVYEEFFDEA